MRQGLEGLRKQVRSTGRGAEIDDERTPGVGDNRQVRSTGAIAEPRKARFRPAGWVCGEC